MQDADSDGDNDVIEDDDDGDDGFAAAAPPAKRAARGGGAEPRAGAAAAAAATPSRGRSTRAAATGAGAKGRKKYRVDDSDDDDDGAYVLHVYTCCTGTKTRVSSISVVLSRGTLTDTPTFWHTVASMRPLHSCRHCATVLPPVVEGAGTQPTHPRPQT